jgi:hypothetical protein
MEPVKPRFEFRTFAQSFGIVIQKMRELSPCSSIRESSEIYIMSRGNNENNTKIRDGKMDIKVFVKEELGLEQWNPRMKGVFPMTAAVIKEEVFPAFGVEVPVFKRDVYTQEQYLKEIIDDHRDLNAVRVFKRRFGFSVYDTIVEHGEILINGAAIQTVAVESTDIDAILKARTALALDEYENINYLLAIKRVVGMEPLPE